MNVNQAVNTALQLLGYTDENGNGRLTRRILSKALAVANTVYNDLCGVLGKEHEPIGSMTQEIDLAGRALEAFPYGLAAFLAQSENDADNQQLWMTIYNRKRAGLSKITAVEDNFLRGGDS